jgi:hypothetical protein
VNAKKTGPFLGPGSYYAMDSFNMINRSPCGVLYRDVDQSNKAVMSGECYYVGNSLVVDPDINHLSKLKI